MLEDSLFQISNPEIQDYIFNHENEDEKKLVLAHKDIFGIPSSLIANQIQGRRKVKQKINLWYSTRGIIYPPSLNLEQCSSEATSKFKSSLITTGKTAADLTGGFGVDSYFLSKKFERFYYIEPDKNLLSIARHNHKLLGAENIEYVNSTAEEFINKSPGSFDMIYIDPSRRNKQQKVFKLSDCVPDVSRMLTSLLESSERVMIKNSPLLDIQQGLRELQNTEKVYVLSVNNEVKELLFLVGKKNFISSPPIEAVGLNNYSEPIHTFSFNSEEEKNSEVGFSPPLSFLYEPDASLLKAGAFKSIAQKHNVYKLHPSTHLYTSENRVEYFPGRIFKILQHKKPDKNLKENFPDGYANILTRNYPLSVEEIKKKTGLKEGGTLFLICTQSEREKHVLIAERIKQS